MSGISQLRLKVSVDGAETRRFALEAPINFARLRQLIQDLLQYPGFSVSYTDDDGEQVTLASDADLQEAIAVMEDMNQKALKLSVVTAEVPAVQVGPAKQSVENPVASPVDIEEKETSKDEPAVEDSAGQERAKFEAAIAYVVDQFSRLEPPIVQHEVFNLVVLLQQISQKIEAGEQLQWDALVNHVSFFAPVISSLPCFHDEHQQLLDSLDVIIKFFEGRIETEFIHCVPAHLVPLLILKSEKIFKGFSQVQGVPDKLQVALQNVEALVKKVQTILTNLAEGQDEKSGQSVHVGVQCDNCNAVPIVGNRYKCTVCHNFDLCEACESSGVHPLNHELIKLRVARVQRIPGVRVFVGRPYGPCHGAYARKWRHSQCPQSRAAEKHEEKRDTQPVRKELSAEFVEDVNIADKTHIGGGQFLVKTWSVRNNGRVDWDESVKLVYVSGDQEILVDNQVQFDIPLLKTGQVGEVNVPFIAPTRPGTYKTVFAFTRNGKQFGHPLWVEFVSE